MKLVTRIQNLNGWQRLYVVALIFFYIPLVFLVARNPFVPDPQISQITSQLPEFSKNLLKQNKISIRYESGFGQSGEPVPSSDFPNKIEWDKVQIAVDSVSFDATNSLGFFQDLVLDVYQQMPESDVSKAATEIYKTAESIREHDLMHERLWMLLRAAILAVGIYAFGYALGWIYKGFKKAV